MAAKLKTTAPIPILGIDVSKPGEHVAARATTSSRNVYIHRSLIRKRSGTESAGLSLGERIQEMVELDTGSAFYFVRMGQTKFEEFDKDSLVWSDRAHAALTGTVNDQISYAFPLLSGTRILVYTNGRDAIRKYSGGSNDALLGGTPPITKYVLFYGNLLLALNVTEGGNRYPWRVQWPDIGNPENWSTGDAGSADLLDDSEEITGGGILGQFATVHKPNAIYVGQPNNTSSVLRFERRETGAGTVAHRTIVSLPSGEQIFLARDGIRVFNGISAPLVESPINDELRDYLNPTYAFKSFSKIVKELDEVQIAVPIGSDEEPSTIYRFNYVTRQIHKDTRSSLTAIGEYKNTSGQMSWDALPHTWDSWVGPWDSIALSDLNPVYVYGFSTGDVTKQNTGSTDSGTAIDAEWDSKDFSAIDYQAPAEMLMRWQGARFIAKGSGTAEVFYSIDSGSSWSSAGTITLSDDFPTDYAPQVVYFDTVSTRCRLRITHNGNNQTFAMKQFVIVAVPREGGFLS